MRLMLRRSCAVAVICWYENYQFGPLVRRYLPVKGRIQQIDEGLNGGVSIPFEPFGYLVV